MFEEEGGTKMKKNNQKYLNIKLDKKRLSNMINFLVFWGIILLIGIIFVKLIIPIVFIILSIFFLLLRIYPSLDINFKFIGGIFFLFLYWKVYLILINVICYLFKEAGKRIDNYLNRRKKK